MIAFGTDGLRRLEAALRTGTVLTRFRDLETAGHLQRVALYARLIARKLAVRWGLSDEEVEAIALFSAAHDIGKLAVPEVLLGKREPLDEEESDRMRAHTVAGAAIVEGIVSDLKLEESPHLSVLRNIVRSHHELLDGSGYPDGLAGDEIPPEARIVAVADLYDALRSVRSYKEPWDLGEAISYLRAGAGLHLDPECVDAMTAGASELEEIRRAVAGRHLTDRAPDPQPAPRGTPSDTTR